MCLVAVNFVNIGTQRNDIKAQVVQETGAIAQNISSSLFVEICVPSQ